MSTVYSATQPSSVDQPSDVQARVLRRIVPFLLLCYVCSYLDRINVGFAKLQMARELRFSETAYGLGAGIFFISYFLFEVPSNMAMMRTGARFWIGRIMVTWGLISGATMFIQSETSYYTMRFLLGVAEAGFIPAVLYYLSCWIPSKTKGQATAIFMMGIPLSGILGGPLSGGIIQGFDGVAGLSGWRWMFILEAIPTVLAGLFAFKWLSDSPAKAKWLSPLERAQLTAELEADGKTKLLHSTRDGLTDKRVWGLSVLYIFYSMGLYAISFWLPSIIQQSGASDPLTVGSLAAIPYSTALITMLLVGRSSDRTRERRWHLALPALAGAAGLCISVRFATDPTLGLIGLAIAASGIITCVPQFYCLPPAILGGSAAAMGFAVANSIGCLAGFVSPYMIGWIKDSTGSTDAGLLLVAACLVVGALGALSVPKAMVNR